MNGKLAVEDVVRPCESLQKLLCVVGGSIRFELLAELAEVESNVTGLMEHLQLCLPHVSSNLKVLRNHGLVEVEQIKKHRVYRLTNLVQCQHVDDALVLRMTAADGDTIEITVRKKTRSNARSPA